MLLGSIYKDTVESTEETALNERDRDTEKNLYRITTEERDGLMGWYKKCETWSSQPFFILSGSLIDFNTQLNL